MNIFKRCDFCFRYPDFQQGIRGCHKYIGWLDNMLWDDAQIGDLVDN